MHLFTITASCRSIVHCLLLADVAAGVERGGWIRPICLSVRPSQFPPGFKLSPRKMGDTSSLRTHSGRDGVQQARMRDKLWLAWG